MDRRIQQVLDGELPREELNSEEAAALKAEEALIDGVLGSVPTRPLPDLGDSVLRRIAAAQRSEVGTRERNVLRDLLAWLWRPRPISVRWRPAYGVALFAVLALAVPITNAQLSRRMPGRVVQPVFMQFRLDAPRARKVELAGGFTGWKPTLSMTRAEPGIWTVVVPLPPGVHDYAFIVDGERWVPDPMAPAVADGFGGLNSRVAVMTPVRRARL
jgi:AMP-activated protein kinase-like protein